jgi:hypothetical protein
VIGTIVLSKIVRATILSTRVDGHGLMPVSIFIVAPFEHGKTRLALENAAPETLILTDITGMGMLEALQINPNATTMIVNDLSAVTGHRASVNKLTISILNALAEEGSYKIAMPKMAHLDLRGRRVNVIACCVPDVVQDNRSWWHRSGFMSRLLTVRFEHSISLQIAVHKNIQNGGHEEKPGVLHIPLASIKVEFPEKESNELALLSQRIYSAYKETGYRKHKQIRSLAAGHALMRGWKNVKIEQADVQFIEECLPFLIEGSKI